MLYEVITNMKPDPKTKTVVSEIWNGYNDKNQHELTVFTNKWLNGQLKTIKKKNIVITSYSIHYTKLYDIFLKRK